MSERLLRIILAGVMFITLFLPLKLSDPECTPTWAYMLWGIAEYIAAMSCGINDVNFVRPIFILLSFLTVPLLILLNACLAICSFRELRMLYRLLLLVLLPLTWYRTFLTDPFYRGIGFWANAAVVSAAMLVEIVLVVSAQLGKSEDAGS